jgi:DNA-3-methyladenine glycosylase
MDRVPGRLLKHGFFEAAPEHVAPRLLGKVLVHKTRGGMLAGRIVEVEAYLGPHRQPADPAAHAHRGPTPRNSVLFGPAGHAYIYAIYGRYFCMNISCEREGRAGCVLLRALEPVAGLVQMARNRGLVGAPQEKNNRRSFDSVPLARDLAQDDKRRLNPQKFIECGAALRLLTSGPGRLCQAMGLERERHNGIDLLDANSPLQVRDDGTRVERVLVTRRIGIWHAVELPLRFAIPGNACVSGPRTIVGKCIVLRSG